MSFNFMAAIIDAENSASLFTSADSNLRDRVLGELEKDNFIALPGRGGHSGLMPLKTMCSHLGEDNEKFYSNCSKRV